ncbi:MAG: dihydrolipoyl dehydrogenase [Campylobacterales bacterium]
MSKKVEVAIIGAGSAGLYAESQVRKKTQDYVLINGGAHGTTCARVGCMPSKALIQIAHCYHERKHFADSGISGAEHLSVDISKVLDRVRSFRDRFVGGIISSSIDTLGEKRVDGYAKFIDRNTLEVDGERIEAQKIIIATGSTPIIPKEWESFSDKLLTTDTIFEQKTLPKKIAVVGLGIIGLEIGQALSRLGIEVVGASLGEKIAGIGDPEVNAKAIELIGAEFPLWLGVPVELQECGDGIKLRSGDREVVVDKVLVSLGRRAFLEHLGLENLGIELDVRGLPKYNKNTMQVEDLPIFIAGDVNGDRQILHEAGDEGRIAGYNTVHSEIRSFKRKVPFGVVFSDPNIVFCGARYKEIESRDDTIVGRFDFKFHGRAVVMNKNAGILSLYVDKKDGLILGSEIIAPNAEHLAHHITWAIEQGLSVYELIKMPYYHPVIEEGLQAALIQCIKKIGVHKEGILESYFLD